MELLDQAILQIVDVKNIVHSYNSVISEYCNNALILLWTPYELINYETYYRLLLADKLIYYDRYKKFHAEISLPFQQKALNLIVPVKVGFQFFKKEYDYCDNLNRRGYMYVYIYIYISHYIALCTT